MGKSNSKNQNHQSCCYCYYVNETKVEDEYKQYVTYVSKYNYPVVNRVNCQYLLKKGIQLNEASVVVYIQLNSQIDEKSLGNLIQKVQDKNSQVLVVHTDYDLSLRQELTRAIMLNPSLLKVSIELVNKTQIQSGIIEQFSTLVQIYESLDSLRYLSYKEYYYNLRIDEDSQLFQLELAMIQEAVQEVDSNIRIFPINSKVKFQKLEISFNSIYMVNMVEKIIEFLEFSNETLNKVSLSLRSLKEEEKIHILDKLTDINKNYGQLKELYLKFYENYDDSKSDFDDYFFKNQNLDYLILNNFGMHQNTLQIEINDKNNLKIQYIIIKLIKNIPKIKSLYLNGKSSCFGDFMETFELIPERRIKLVLHYSEYELKHSPNIYKKLIKNQYFDLELPYQQNHFEYTSARKVISYLNEIKLYMIMSIVIKKQLQEYLLHRSENSFIDLYVD